MSDALPTPDQPRPAARLRTSRATTPPQPLPVAVAEGVGRILAILQEECGADSRGRLAWSFDRHVETDRWVLFLSFPDSVERVGLSAFMKRIAAEIDPVVLGQLTLDFEAPAA
ncbi:MAG: hypothetical protein ACT4OZ_00635 [Gemmatimonadota bacterium]